MHYESPWRCVCPSKTNFETVNLFSLKNGLGAKQIILLKFKAAKWKFGRTNEKA